MQEKEFLIPPKPETDSSFILSFSEVLGQKSARSLLESALRRGRLAHSYLFVGPKGVGKKTMAYAFIYHLFCATNSEKPCGECMACKKLKKRLHPDVMLISPEKRDIRIDTIRSIERFIRLRPLEAPYKVILIERAEKMNLEAGNALLKSLEEPPGYVIFILLTENLLKLLPTIISRSQVVRFHPLARETIKEYLFRRDLDESMAETLAELSSGSLGRALEMAEKGLLEELNAFVKAGESKNIERCFKIAERLSRLDKDSQELFLYLLTLWVWRSYLKAKVDISYPSAFPEETFKGDPAEALRILYKAKVALDFYVNPELTFYTLMLNLF